MTPNRRRRTSARDAARLHVDRSIRLRVRVYAAIFLVVLAVVVVDAALIGGAAVLSAAIGLVVGAALGAAASRAFRLDWSTVSGTVVGRVDVIGGVVLLAYVALSVFRGPLVRLWVDAPVAGVTSLAVLAGIMAGQAMGTTHGVARVLRVVAADRS